MFSYIPDVFANSLRKLLLGCGNPFFISREDTRKLQFKLLILYFDVVVERGSTA